MRVYVHACVVSAACGMHVSMKAYVHECVHMYDYYVGVCMCVLACKRDEVCVREWDEVCG